MFGDPVKRKLDMAILPWVWTYMYKDTEGELNKDATKSRGTCNGGPRYCNKSSISETYVACVEQPIHQLTWAISAALGLTCKGYDVGNAFAKAPLPKFLFYMQPDAQFRQWWRDCLKKPELAPDDVIPIQHALQGHPESPQLWDKYITKMLTGDKFGFKTCTHEYKTDKTNNLMFIVRQVDDLLVCHVDPKECDKMAKTIQKELTFLLNFLGTVRGFNGVNVDQTKHYNHIHCSTYIDKIVKHHNWENLPAQTPPTPFQANSQHQAEIQLAKGPKDSKEALRLQKKIGFNYQQAIGELIYAYTICCFDIEITIIILSQFSHQPVEIHYKAVKQVFVYLNATKDYGLTYWRPKPLDHLLYKDPPQPITPYYRLVKYNQQSNAVEL